MLPRLELLNRQRPVAVVATTLPHLDRTYPDGDTTHGDTPHGDTFAVTAAAPYLAVELDLAEPAGRVEISLHGPAGTHLTGWYDAGTGRVGWRVALGSRTLTSATRRRLVRGAATPAGSVALTLTGTHLAMLTRRSPGEDWVVRSRYDLDGLVDTRDEEWLAGLAGSWAVQGTDETAAVGALRAGSFGQLGLRDLHLATNADGSPYVMDGGWVYTATHAGPGFFDTGHTGVWAFDPASHRLRHLADLFFHRPDTAGVYGDHATHLVRDGDEWLVATSTWGDFDHSSMRITTARTNADLLSGTHVLDTEHLALPLAQLPGDCAGVWDPHLVRDGEDWLVAFVAARSFFDFYPALATGPGLDKLSLRGADPRRTATEGTVLVRIDGHWRLLASDGPDSPRAIRRRYVGYDLDLTEVGTLDAPYGTNLPWPMVTPYEEGWLMVTFDGTPYGGPVPGYGTHGDVLVLGSRTEPSG